MRVTRQLLILAAACTLLQAPRAAEPEPADYDTLPGRKALATLPDDPKTWGIAQSATGDLAATTAALRQCNDRAAGRGSCELVRLNTEQIDTSADILAAVGTAPHPLFLWRITSPTATAYLAGSVHILKPNLYPMPEPMDEAFMRADTLVLEVDLSLHTPDQMQIMSMAAGALPPGDQLRQVVPAPLYARLEETLARYGIPAAVFEGQSPIMVMNQLVILRFMALGYDPSTGLEAHYLARLGDRKVLQLETLAAQLDVLFNQPMATQIQLLSDTLDLDGEMQPLMRDLLIAWLAGDDAAFEQTFAEQAGDSELAREFNRQILDQRNIGMATGIADLLETSGTYFVLVGAAHFPGGTGIIKLLEQAGVKVQRLHSDTVLTYGET